MEAKAIRERAACKRSFENSWSRRTCAKNIPWRTVGGALHSGLYCISTSENGMLESSGKHSAKLPSSMSRRRDSKRKHAKQQNADTGSDAASTPSGRNTAKGMSRNASEASSMTPMLIRMRCLKMQNTMLSTPQAIRLPYAMYSKYSSEVFASSIACCTSGGILRYSPGVYSQSPRASAGASTPTGFPTLSQFSSASPSKSMSCGFALMSAAKHAATVFVPAVVNRATHARVGMAPSL